MERPFLTPDGWKAIFLRQKEGVLLSVTFSPG
jgi:hypothetical protein